MAATQLPPVPDHHAVVQHRPAVAVVDADPAVRHSLEFFLEVEGYRVTTYTFAEAAGAFAEIPKAACLVIDFGVPEISGLDFIAGLRAAGHRIPAVLIASNPDAATHARAEDLGATVIEKPLLGDRFGLAIKAALDS